MQYETVTTKRDGKQSSKIYYKVWQILQSVTGCYYKLRQVLQSVTGCYYRVRQVLKNGTVITKWDVTLVNIDRHLKTKDILLTIYQKY